MSLRDLQTALGILVVERTSATELTGEQLKLLDQLNLTASERAWLEQLVDSSGFAVTCYIQRKWREIRLQWTVPLTLASLESGKRAEILTAYLDAVPFSSFFFIPEALQFLDFVICSVLDNPYTGEIARFERAMLIAAEAASSSSAQGVLTTTHKLLE